MCVLQDGLGGGFACTVPTACVHPDHEGLTLQGAAAHSVLQSSAVLQRVQGHHAVVVICRQEQDGRIGRARVRFLRQIMKRRIPGEKVRDTEISKGKNAQQNSENCSSKAPKIQNEDKISTGDNTNDKKTSVKVFIF